MQVAFTLPSKMLLSFPRGREREREREGYRNLSRVKEKRSKCFHLPLRLHHVLRRTRSKRIRRSKPTGCSSHQRLVLIFVSAFRWIAWRKALKKKKKKECTGSGTTWHKSVLRYRNTHDHGEKWAWLGAVFLFVRWPFVAHRARKTSSHAHPVYWLPGCGINCIYIHTHVHIYTRHYRFASWNDKLNATIDSSLAFENLGATFSGKLILSWT